MLKKICGILSGIILLVLAVLAGLLIIPKLMGYEEMAVLTGSMEPNYPVGSLIFVKEIEPDQLEVGDVITYRLNSDTVVTHRIVEIDKEAQTVTTKGDANSSNDGSPVPYSEIVGKAHFKIPYLGYVSMNIKTPKGIMAICGVLIAIILLTFLPEIFSPEEEEEQKEKPKRRKRKE
ncbi:signal peptidase I [Ruminococcus sp. OM05-10BH]|nr:signal peptidase I [Ruminococcus sp. OM05-10BH]